MVFLAYTHWRRALRNGSFVLLIKQKMKTKQVVAVIGASREMARRKIKYPEHVEVDIWKKYLFTYKI